MTCTDPSSMYMFSSDDLAGHVSYYGGGNLTDSSCSTLMGAEVLSESVPTLKARSFSSDDSTHL